MVNIFTFFQFSKDNWLKFNRKTGKQGACRLEIQEDVKITALSFASYPDQALYPRP